MLARESSFREPKREETVLTDTRGAIVRKKVVFSSERTQEPLFAHKQPHKVVSRENKVRCVREIS